MKRITVLLILCTAFLSACSSTRWVRTDVEKQHKFTLTLERLQGKGGSVPEKYAHPYKIALADLKKVMKEITYMEKTGLMNEKEQRPVFQEAEIDRLAPALAAALAKADAGQRVRFISFNQAEAMFFSRSRKSEGVIFVAPDVRLNVAFNYINSDRAPSETSALYVNYSNVEPLNINASDTPIVSTTSYAQRHSLASGKQAPMWVAADLEKLKTSISAVPVATAESSEVVKSPAPEANRGIAPVAAPETHNMRAPVEKTVPVQQPATSLREEIRNKLKYLKELQSEGLITEQDYNAKKMELLDKID